MWKLMKVFMLLFVCSCITSFVSLEKQFDQEIYYFSIDRAELVKVSGDNGWHNEDNTVFKFKIDFTTSPREIKAIGKAREVPGVKTIIEDSFFPLKEGKAHSQEEEKKKIVKKAELESQPSDNKKAPKGQEEITLVEEVKEVARREIVPKIKIKIEPSLEIDFVYHEQSETKGSKIKYKKSLSKVKLKSEVNITISDTTSVFADVVVQFDNGGFSGGGPEGLTERTGRYNLNSEELFVKWCQGNYSLLIGKQEFDWSVTDTVSPSDNLSPRDFTELTDWERVGISAVSFRFDGMDYFWQAVFVPKFTGSKLSRGRWQETLPTGVCLDEIVDKNQAQFALRVGKTVGMWDLTAGYYRGVSFNPFGVLRIDENGATLECRYSKEKVYSLAATGVVGDYVLTWELGYFKQSEGDNFVQSVGGIRRDFCGIFTDNDTLSVLMQYSDEKIISKDNSIIRITDFRRNFRKSIISRVSYEKGMNSPWRYELEGMVNLSKKDYFLKPKVIYSRDNWEIETGIEVTGGAEDSFWGKYDKANSVFAQFTINF